MGKTAEIERLLETVKLVIADEDPDEDAIEALLKQVNEVIHDKLNISGNKEFSSQTLSFKSPDTFSIDHSSFHVS
jgi:hypothetical protein